VNRALHDPRSLSDQELINRTAQLAIDQRDATVQLLHHLNEISRLETQPGGETAEARDAPERTRTGSRAPQEKAPLDTRARCARKTPAIA